MKCDLCGREFNNAEELKQHREEMHPMDEHEVKDMDEKNPEIEREVSDSEVEMPAPVERTR